MSFIIQLEQKEKLEKNNVMTLKEIMHLVEAFQIASGQSFALGKTKAIVEFLKSGNVIIIKDFDGAGENRTVSTVKELADIFRSIDRHVDLEKLMIL